MLTRRLKSAEELGRSGPTSSDPEQLRALEDLGYAQSTNSAAYGLWAEDDCSWRLRFR